MELRWVAVAPDTARRRHDVGTLQPVDEPGRHDNCKESDTMRLKRALVAIALFAVAFGYVEAAVVVYLRTICDGAEAVE